MSMQKYPIIAVIGAGNMGKSLIAGLIKTGHPPETIWATTRTEEKLKHLQEEFHVHTTTDNRQAAETADVIILAMKPNALIDVITPLRDIVIEKKPLVICVAAGIAIKNITRIFTNEIPIVRVMPNIASQIGLGASVFCNNECTTTEEIKLAESILKGTGIAIRINDEKLMNVVTALSGNGPAYFFLMMEALQEAAEELGLPADIARVLTLQTAIGAAQMALISNMAPSVLRKKVTSPGGTTEKAISVLEENNFKGLFKKALLAATEHAKELAAKYN